jgi:hypothetical protein
MQSDQINELASALSKAQSEINPAIKDSTNPFFKSKYADLSSVWNACKDPLTKNGLAILQTMDIQNGQTVLVTTLAHSSGQWMKSFLPVINEKNNAQGLGSALTYNRRYALSAIVGIICDEDDDAEGATNRTISKEQVQTLSALLDQCDDVYVQNVYNYYKISAIKELPADKYEGLFQNISNKIKVKKVG